MYRQSDDMETGFVSAGRGQSSSSDGGCKDALFGSTTRKIVTGVTSLAIFILLITTIVFATRSASDDNGNVVPPSAAVACPTGCASGILPSVYRSTKAGNIVSYAGSPDTTPAAMPVNFTVAFTADTYITGETQKLYRVLRDEGAEFIAISGDLDYIDYPEGWDHLITDTLGEAYPMLVAAGNHDYLIWPQYADKIVTRWQKAGIKTCEGVVGVMHVCTWKGLTIVQIAPGVFNESDSRNVYKGVNGVDDIDFVQFIRDSFAKYPSQWKVCSWHKNQRLMQTGTKTNETGWGVYNECLAQGAMVMTGHEHSYERSYQMSSFENVTVASTDNPRELTLTSELGIVVVQGLGGREARIDAQPQQTWWASRDNKGTTNTSDVFSGVVCKYNLNGDMKKAYCYDKRINDGKGKVYDDFFITLP